MVDRKTINPLDQSREYYENKYTEEDIREIFETYPREESNSGEELNEKV